MFINAGERISSIWIIDNRLSFATFSVDQSKNLSLLPSFNYSVNCLYLKSFIGCIVSLVCIGRLDPYTYAYLDTYIITETLKNRHPQNAAPEFAYACVSDSPKGCIRFVIGSVITWFIINATYLRLHVYIYNIHRIFNLIPLNSEFWVHVQEFVSCWFYTSDLYRT